MRPEAPGVPALGTGAESSPREELELCVCAHGAGAEASLVFVAREQPPEHQQWFAGGDSGQSESPQHGWGSANQKL